MRVYISSFALLLASCSDQPDPHTTNGLVAFMAQAIDADDTRKLYQVLDERERHALISIHADRQAAAAVIRRDYPEASRDEALGELGDGVTAASPEALFALRCDRRCRQEFSAVLAPVRGDVAASGEVTIETGKGVLRAYRATADKWWGFVWRWPDLDRERTRANQDLRVIEQNAQLHRRRQELSGH